MIHKLGVVALAVTGLAMSGVASSRQEGMAMANVRDASGASLGSLMLMDSHSGILITGDLAGLPAGVHGIHVHAVGKCEAPFTTAGGHFNPGMKKHGFKSGDGPHMGDLSNITTPASGSTHVDLLLAGVTLKGANALLDADGAAIVIHATQDDYATDPAGNSGARIACGVITAS